MSDSFTCIMLRGLTVLLASLAAYLILRDAFLLAVLMSVSAGLAWYLADIFTWKTLGKAPTKEEKPSRVDPMYHFGE